MKKFLLRSTLCFFSLIAFSFSVDAATTATHHHKAKSHTSSAKKTTLSSAQAKKKTAYAQKHASKKYAHNTALKKKHATHTAPLPNDATQASAVSLTDKADQALERDASTTTTNTPTKEVIPSSTSMTMQEEAPKPHSFLSWLKGERSNETAESTANEARTFMQPTTHFAHSTVATLNYSRYSFGGNRFDAKNGIYLLDCSGYVDHILHQSSPRAYSLLAQSSGSDKPNSAQYYSFFNRLSASNYVPYRWNKIENPQELQPGDILVFRYTNARGKASGGGHVMLVMNKPKGDAHVVSVRVADSAKTGHTADTRGNRASGIGIGTLLLKINPATEKPYAFAWRVDSPWNTRVSIAMGRPPTA